MSAVSNANRREKYRKNPALYIDRAAKWAKEHPEYVKQHHVAYYKENKERLREAMNQYGKSPRGKAASLRAREKSRQKNRERSRIWRLNHPGATTKQVRSWAERYPEKYRLVNANKYANRKQQGEQDWRLTPHELNAMFTQQNGVCAYCAISISSAFVIEHKMPLSRGGRHVPSNVCLACSRCNTVKSNKTYEEFMLSMSETSIKRST